MRILLYLQQKKTISRTIALLMSVVLGVISVMWIFPYFGEVKITETETENKDAITIESEQNIGEQIVESESVIEDVSIEYEYYRVPWNNGFKSYMDYRIFSKSSNQYKLQQIAQNGKYGIRTVNDRFCVVIGTHFLSNATIGQYLDIVLENGTIIECVLADVKADEHTDLNNIVTEHNGCMTEFVVDMLQLSKISSIMGNLSYVDDDWNSSVKGIVVYQNMNIFEQEDINE